MSVKFLLSLILTVFLFSNTRAALTFKNVIVLCEGENIGNEEITFTTTVTASSLKQHLPFDQGCFRIEINHASLPTVFEGAFANIRQVTYLLLENNDIQEIYPGAFTNSSVQQGMSLKFNKLTEIRFGVFNNVDVPSLYLSSNLISKIHPQAFDNMPSLEAIYLDNNQLSYIDSNWFSNTPNLYKLVFRHNFIRRVPRYAFKNLVFKKYQGIQIDLNNNIISFVDVDAFKKPNKYQLISLAKNHINDLMEGWLNNVDVRKLDISHNRLQCLLHNGLAGPNSHNVIDGNPWLCNCLEEIKRKEERGIFGYIAAKQEFKRCSI